MRLSRPALALAIAAALTATAPGALAQSESDRLREALRNATQQVRSLEDQRAVLQARQAEAERERDRLRRQNDALRAQVKEAEQAYQQAVTDFNDRLADRDQTLEKWKSAYSEAATVARSKEAERARLEQKSNALEASGKACQAKNVQLQKVGADILRRFERMDPADVAAIHDPIYGIRRVEHQNTVQDYRDKILDQKVMP